MCAKNVDEIDTSGAQKLKLIINKILNLKNLKYSCTHVQKEHFDLTED